MTKGIDISKHNGKIDFSKVKESQDFIIIRAGYGWEWHEDLLWKKYMAECEKVGIPYGLYYYSYACTREQGKKEVAGFLQAIKGCHPSYPVIIDMEDADGYKRKQGAPSWETLAGITLDALQAIEGAGYYAMWYASKSWVDQLIKREPKLKNFDLWLAHWGISKPSMPCGIWQYTSDGRVDGINGRVDCNVGYKDYPTIIKKAGLNGWDKMGQPKTNRTKENQPQDSTGRMNPFPVVKAIEEAVNIREKPDHTSKKIGQIRDTRAHTIVEIRHAPSTYIWGRLEQGGWVALNYFTFRK